MNAVLPLVSWAGISEKTQPGAGSADGARQRRMCLSLSVCGVLCVLTRSLLDGSPLVFFGRASAEKRSRERGARTAHVGAACGEVCLFVACCVLTRSLLDTPW